MLQYADLKTQSLPLFEKFDSLWRRL